MKKMQSEKCVTKHAIAWTMLWSNPSTQHVCDCCILCPSTLLLRVIVDDLDLPMQQCCLLDYGTCMSRNVQLLLRGCWVGDSTLLAAASMEAFIRLGMMSVAPFLASQTQQPLMEMCVC